MADQAANSEADPWSAEASDRFSYGFYVRLGLDAPLCHALGDDPLQAVAAYLLHGASVRTGDRAWVWRAQPVRLDVGRAESVETLGPVGDPRVFEVGVELTELPHGRVVTDGDERILVHVLVDGASVCGYEAKRTPDRRDAGCSLDEADRLATCPACLEGRAALLVKTPELDLRSVVARLREAGARVAYVVTVRASATDATVPALALAVPIVDSEEHRVFAFYADGPCPHAEFASVCDAQDDHPDTTWEVTRGQVAVDENALLRHLRRTEALVADPGSVVCPGCRRTRPRTAEEARDRDYPCCNAACKGEWGTNCHHCHSPHFWKGLVHVVRDDSPLCGFLRGTGASSWADLPLAEGHSWCSLEDAFTKGTCRPCQEAVGRLLHQADALDGVVHALASGTAVCGFMSTTRVGDWPEGHSWCPVIYAHMKANCPKCLSKLELPQVTLSARPISDFLIHIWVDEDIACDVLKGKSLAELPPGHMWIPIDEVDKANCPKCLAEVGAPEVTDPGEEPLSLSFRSFGSGETPEIDLGVVHSDAHPMEVAEAMRQEGIEVTHRQDPDPRDLTGADVAAASPGDDAYAASPAQVTLTVHALRDGVAACGLAAGVRAGLGDHSWPDGHTFALEHVERQDVTCHECRRVVIGVVTDPGQLATAVQGDALRLPLSPPFGPVSAWVAARGGTVRAAVPGRGGTARAAEPGESVPGRGGDVVRPGDSVPGGGSVVQPGDAGRLIPMPTRDRIDRELRRLATMPDEAFRRVALATFEAVWSAVEDLDRPVEELHPMDVVQKHLQRGNIVKDGKW